MKNEALKARFVLVFCIVVIVLLLQVSFLRINAQFKSGFEIFEKENEVEVAYFEAGIEKFRVVINKNGGLSQVLISQIPYTSVAGCYVWSVWEQTWFSRRLAPPIIENKGDYVEARFYGKYTNIEVYTETNYTISKTGLILISNTIEARADLPEIRNTLWMIYFPVDIFQGEKAYVKFGKEIREITLPQEVASGDFVVTTDVFYWVDFSRGVEGITFINMAPGSEIWYSAGVRDERQWGYHNVYGVRITHKAEGEGEMIIGEKRFSKVALYVHGPGGYQANEEMINLISELASVQVECEKALKKYSKDSEAWILASQAMATVNAGLNKLIIGDKDGAKTDLENANGLLQKAKTAGGEVVPNLLLIIALAAIVVVVIGLIFLRKRSRKK
ncbi:MAG: hypothetical protein FGF52_05105 [Candidatus Brockarchaeota archaeon]|nr:hypothetical protein [Candidatus Brockarchaeota archaeon]